MRKTCVVTVDLVDVWAEPGRKKLARTLAWGDEVVIRPKVPPSSRWKRPSSTREPDGSILPVKVAGSSLRPRGRKATDLVKPKAQNDAEGQLRGRSRATDPSSRRPTAR
jgi:hypothetical protein